MIPQIELVKKSFDMFYKNWQINNFYYKICFDSFLKSINEVTKDPKENNRSSNDFSKILAKNMSREFDKCLRSDHFLNMLGACVDNNFEVYDRLYNNGITKWIHYNFDFYLKNFYSPFLSYSKKLKLSDHKVVFQKDRVKLLHYINTFESDSEKFENNILLIIYAPINRFHILDLNPSKSVVRNLLSNNIDVYILDWGYPDNEDNELKLKNYIEYIDNAVNFIIEKSKNLKSGQQLKISILGYCWGGITALIYSALNQKNLNKLILMATPVDFSKDDTTVSLWSKVIDYNKFIDVFGHFDGYFLDYIFAMRNPAKFLFGKYLSLLKNLDKKEYIDTFIDVEKWLHDTPPIPGELYRKIMKDCYKNNLLIKGKMYLEDKKLSKFRDQNNNSQKIQIDKISIPILSIIAEKDNLVSPDSSLAINDYIKSQEKIIYRHSGGHVSLCISDDAHKELWPKVANWIKA